MDSKFKLIVDSFGKDRFKFDEQIKDYTALNVGGPAKLFFIAFTTAEIIKIVGMCRQLKLPYFLFGTGSKMMISDNGFDGLVIKNRTKNIHVVSVKGKATRFGIGVDEALIEVESGVSINKMVEFLDSQGLSSAGLEGMQGSVGGNVIFSRFLQTKAKSIKVYTLDPDRIGVEGEVDEIEATTLSPKKHMILSAVFRIKAKS